MGKSVIVGETINNRQEPQPSGRRGAPSTGCRATHPQHTNTAVHFSYTATVPHLHITQTLTQEEGPSVAITVAAQLADEQQQLTHLH